MRDDIQLLEVLLDNLYLIDRPYESFANTPSGIEVHRAVLPGRHLGMCSLVTRLMRDNTISPAEMLRLQKYIKQNGPAADRSGYRFPAGDQESRRTWLVLQIGKEHTNRRTSTPDKLIAELNQYADKRSIVILMHPTTMFNLSGYITRYASAMGTSETFVFNDEVTVEKSYSVPADSYLIKSK